MPNENGSRNAVVLGLKAIYSLREFVVALNVMVLLEKFINNQDIIIFKLVLKLN
jgi:hypothetical protein